MEVYLKSIVKKLSPYGLRQLIQFAREEIVEKEQREVESQLSQYQEGETH